MAKIELPDEVRQKFREAGSRGGKTTVQRHGSELFKRIGKLGGAASKRGPSKKRTRVGEEVQETAESD